MMKSQLIQLTDRSTHRLSRFLGKLMPLLTGFLLLLGAESCNEPRDPSSYSGTPGGYARVSVLMNSSSKGSRINSSNRLLNKLSASPPNGSALVIAVAEGTSFSLDYTAVEGYLDKQMVDLAASTVTLTLPMNTSIELFEYVFVESYTLSDLENSSHRVFSSAVLGPFTLTSSTTSIELEANLEYALDAPFSDLMTAGSYNIEYDEYDGTIYYTYADIDWQNLPGTSYVFNSASRQFDLGTSPHTIYELNDTEWVATTIGHMPNATLDYIDPANRTVYYTNPDFSATLVAMLDLAATGLGDSHDNPDSDEESDVFMTGSDFTPGSLGYIFEINGNPDSDYRLEDTAKTHDCYQTEFSTLDDFISHHTTSGFTCQGGEYSSCLRFKQDAPGDTSGILVEVSYDGTPTVGVGTWEITTVQTKEMLFFYPDNTDYFYGGTYAPFWSVLNGKVWEGSRLAPGITESMYLPTFNLAAIDDYRRFLETASPEVFVSDKGESCSTLYWDEGSWDYFIWAP